MASNWDMLVPLPAGTIHNLIRNPGFEYNDQYFGGTRQYWRYYDGASALVTSSYPLQSRSWSAMGANSLSLALDGTTARSAYYSPRLEAFDVNSVVPTGVTVTNPGGGGTQPALTAYTSGTHYFAIMLLTPFGNSLAISNDTLPMPTATPPSYATAKLISNGGYQQIDLLRGHSAPVIASASITTAGTRQLSFTMPATHPYPANSLGYAVFWATPTLVSGLRWYRLLEVRTFVPDGVTVDVLLPEETSNWGRNSTNFFTNDSVSPTQFSVYTSGTNASLPTNIQRADYIGADTSAPAFGVSPQSVAGTTYKHHLYVEWYVDANYTASTSPFIACAYDYRVTFIDAITGTTYTPVNPATGDNRLASAPSNRALAPRAGRTKFLLAPPDNTSNVNAGRDLRLKIEIVSPTGSYTGNAAVLYIDNVQMVDITYRSADSVSWDDVEFTYLDGDVTGAEWHDFAPSYRTTSGTAINGMDKDWYWLGDSYANWYIALGITARDRQVRSNTVVNNTYGGTSQLGYAQSMMRAVDTEIGIYVPIDDDNMGAVVNTSTTGSGMPEITTISQAYGIVDGGMIQRQVASTRTIQLSVDIVGQSISDLHNRRRRLINALKFDQLVQQGDRVIRYRGSGTPIIWRTTYTAGLEFNGTVGVSFTESATVQFTCADPYAYAERSVGINVALAPTTQDTSFYVAYRLGDNLPWQYTGLGYMQDYTIGPGTITTTAGSASVTGTNTAFTYKDVGKQLRRSSDNAVVGIISTVGTVGAGAGVVTLVANAAVVATNFAYALVAPVTSAGDEQLNWSGGFKKYHIGFIESPVNNSLMLFVGGFDNGASRPNLGMSKYLAVLQLDGVTNTEAGNTSSANIAGITLSVTLGSATITASTAYFTPDAIGKGVYINNGGTFVGTIYSVTNATTAVLQNNTTVATGSYGFSLEWMPTTVNSTFSTALPLLHREMTSGQTFSATRYYSVEPIGAITAIYQESPYSLLLAGTFRAFNETAVAISDIRVIRVRGNMQRQATTSTSGAPTLSSTASFQDVEILARTSDGVDGTIDCITTDLAGNIYIGGTLFSISNVYMIGSLNDGSTTVNITNIGQITESVIALVTDAKYPVANVFAAIQNDPWILVYPFYYARGGSEPWLSPPNDTTYGTTQKPDDIIYAFMRTQANDIIAVGGFKYWGASLIDNRFVGPECRGLARIIPRITAPSSTYLASGLIGLPAVPAAGNFNQPGIDNDAGESVMAIADYSYSPLSTSFTGTGERIAFGGYFSNFNDGRWTLAFGYLEGSGSASSVRRMAVSDIGIPVPLIADNYPVVQAIATTTRDRFYYNDRLVTRTDNLVGPSIAVLMTKASGDQFASAPPMIKYGSGGYAMASGFGVPQSVSVPIQVRGTAVSYPVITIRLSWQASVFELVQTETGARIRFDDMYGLRGAVAPTGVQETIIIDFRPGFRSLTSNIRGSLMQYVSADSNFADFYFLPPTTTNTTADTYRENTLMIRYATVMTATNGTVTSPDIVISYTPRFWSFDTSRLFTDSPDTPLM